MVKSIDFALEDEDHDDQVERKDGEESKKDIEESEKHRDVEEFEKPADVTESDGEETEKHRDNESTETLNLIILYTTLISISIYLGSTLWLSTSYMYCVAISSTSHHNMGLSQDPDDYINGSLSAKRKSLHLADDNAPDDQDDVPTTSKKRGLYL
ncbi:hypothetical protein DdX_02912 [Ditylenchus destructor]|uniref:Uncharacterized protein n=1 Tax=Ditylenchus destructor TaxID=166010 RepID=A0AAD4R9J4_9BILA|nr:hypothetical protein DdX_02912 [Ditylenchus destructor]